MFDLTIIALWIAGCSSATVGDHQRRRPANQAELGEIVTAAEAGPWCDEVGPGNSCLVSWSKASTYCRDPRLAELRPADIKGRPRKDGFYKVACEPNSDGTDETFYMNDFGYIRSGGLPGNHRVWTATSPPGHPEAAHVVYDEWGGGGGEPVEHLKRTPNAFRCAHGV